MKNLTTSILTAAFLVAISSDAAERKRVSPHVQAMNVGSVVSGQIATPSEQDRFTFPGTIGQRLYFDALDFDGDSMSVTVIAPSGSIVLSTPQHSDSVPFYLVENGSYSVTVDGNGDATGDYRFQILNLGNSRPWNLGAIVSSQLNPSAGTHVYRHEGTAGERLSLEGLSTDPQGVYWRLYGTGNQELFGAGINSSLAEVVLPVSGPCLLLIQGTTEADPINYSFRVSRLSSPTGSTTGFGVKHSGNVDGSTTATFDYTAPAGTVIAYDALEGNFDPATVEIADPDGTLIVSQNAAADSTVMQLQKSGTYRLTVKSSDGTSAADYSFNLLNLSSGSPISVASVQQATLAPFETRAFRIATALGQIVAYDSLEADSEAVGYTFITPLFSAPFGWGNSDNDWQPVIISEPGVHWIVLYNQGTTDADFRFRILDMAQSPTRDAPLNTTITGTVSDSGTQYFRVQGTAGQRLYFDALSETGGAYWLLYNPAAANIGGTSLPNDFEITLPGTGTYFLALASFDDTAVACSFRIIEATATTAPLPIGALVSGALSEVGQEHRFSFDVVAGTTIFYDALDNDFDNINVRLLDPAGSIVAINHNSDSDAGPYTLTAPGTYTLVIGGGTGAVADYRFRLVNLAQAPATPIALDTTISRTLNPATQADLLTFTGSAGQRLFFDSLENTPNGGWTLYGPNNVGLANQGLGGDFHATLPVTGTYVLYVQSTVSEPVPYSVRVVTPPVPSQVLVLGTVVSGTLTEAGEQHRFTFNAVAGQRIACDALDTDNDDIVVQLITTSGSTTISSNSDIDWGPYVITETGLHTVTIGGFSHTLGDYKFRLFDMASGQALALGSPQTVELNPRNSAKVFSYTSAGAERLEIVETAPNSPTAFWYVHSEINELVASGGVNSTIPVHLRFPGTYSFLLVGDSTEGDPVQYGFQLNRISIGGVNDFAGLREGALGAGDVLASTFNAVAGTFFYIDSLLPGSPVSIQILDPNGNAIVGPQGSGADGGPYRFDFTGEYTIRLNGEGGGDYKFALLNLAAGTPITAGEAVSGQIVAQQTLVFLVDGKVDEAVFYDSLISGSEPVDVYFLSPTGVPQFNSGGNAAFSDFRIADMRENGTYFLLVRSFHTDPVDYSFRVLNSGRAPTQTIALDTVVGSPLTIVPASSLSVVGTYFNGSLRSRPDKDDWRVTQVASGTRNDTAINFPEGGWGQLTSVGLVDNASGGQNGSDEDWENFSVQWDGNITIAKPGTRLYTRSDDGSRLWVDVNGDQAFGDEAPEFSDNNWGNGQGATIGAGSAALASGTYSIRVQYEEGNAGNSMELLMDGGASLAARESRLFRFEATAGQRLVFDSMEPSASMASWVLYSAESYLSSGNLASDVEIGVLPRTGTYVLHLNNPSDQPATLAFRITTAETHSFPFQLGVDIDGRLTEADEHHQFTFSAEAGQRLYYDSLQTDFQPEQVIIRAPDGTHVVDNNSDYDASFVAPLTGTYTVEIDDNSYTAGQTYRFRLLDVASTAQSLTLDQEITGQLLNARAILYRVPTLGGLRLYFDGRGSDFAADWYLFNSANVQIGIAPAAGDMELVSNLTEDFLLSVNSGDMNQPVNYTFAVIPGNHVPVFSTIGNRSISEEAAFSFTPQSLDPELPNDVVRYALDPGAPEGLTVNAATGALAWTPTENQGKAEYVITLVATDDGLPNLSYSETFTLSVNEVNKPPTLNALNDIVVDEHSVLATTFVANEVGDPDVPGNTLTFSLEGAPAGASIDPQNAAFFWTPNEAQGPGTYDITVRVTDNNPDAVNEKSLSATRTFRITVNEVNVAPTLNAIADQTVRAGSTLSVTASAFDSDLPAQNLRFSLGAGAPSGAAIDAVTGVLTWKPGMTDASSMPSITVTVTDNSSPALAASRSFKVTVPEISPVQLSIRVANDRPHISVAGDPGLRYRVLVSADLTNWDLLDERVPTAMPFEVADPSGVTPRFYKVELRAD